MSESTLNSLLQILALLAGSRSDSNPVLERNMVKFFLQRQYKKEILESKMVLFKSYYEKYLERIKSTRNLSINAYLIQLTKDLAQNLSFRQRLFILVSLTEFAAFLKLYLEDKNSYQSYFITVKELGKQLSIDPAIIDTCIYFVRGQYHMISPKTNLLVISESKIKFGDDVKNITLNGHKGLCYVLNINRDFFLFKYEGKSITFINDKPISNTKTYFFTLTSNYKINSADTIFFNDINKHFRVEKEKSSIDFRAKSISYYFPKSKNGIQTLDIEGESNEIIGIMGPSGSGKTTLLNLLKGDLPLHSGAIFFNGKEINESGSINRFIGYIPQDDLLIPELSVFENLFYSAKLSLGDIEKNTLKERVSNHLEIFGLSELRNLKVGSVDNKIISGGERRRLNIALEIIRNPLILFADEPTSGLSSLDAQRVINFLRQYALSGKLIFVNIHQPSNEIFYSFNKILILDSGGYPVYFGKPGEALNYFRSFSQTLESISQQSLHTEAEAIFNILGETETTEIGNISNTRSISPETWYAEYYKLNLNKVKEKPTSSELPKSSNVMPSVLNQLLIYIIRTLKVMWFDNQFRILAVIIMPLLAIILAGLCKQVTIDSNGDLSYNLYQNDNLPSFFFLSTIVAVFVGLIVSAQSLFKEKHIWNRDRKLGNSHFSYFSSKIFSFGLLSLFQTFTYSLIAYAILKISGSFLIFWMVLFITAFLSNLVGLICSASFKSIAAIYIMIPLIMVPQILLSGVVVNYDKLNPSFKNERYVPVLGELMPIRWAYEALIINQFKSNRFQKHFFKVDSELSKLNYKSQILIPQLNSLANQLINDLDSKDQTNSFLLLSNELKKLSLECNLNISASDSLKNHKSLNSCITCLKQYNKEISKKIYSLSYRRDQMLQDIGGESFIRELKIKNTNRGIDDLVFNRENMQALIRYRNTYVQKTDPVYFTTQSLIGRSHYYASLKNISKFNVDTIIYNLTILIFMCFIAFFILEKEVVQKILKRFNE